MTNQAQSPDSGERKERKSMLTVKRIVTMFVNIPTLDSPDQQVYLAPTTYHCDPGPGFTTKTFKLEVEFPVRFEQLPTIRAEDCTP